jgi:hypothetical protein
MSPKGLTGIAKIAMYSTALVISLPVTQSHPFGLLVPQTNKQTTQ